MWYRVFHMYSVHELSSLHKPSTDLKPHLKSREIRHVQVQRDRRVCAAPQADVIGDMTPFDQPEPSGEEPKLLKKWPRKVKGTSGWLALQRCLVTMFQLCRSHPERKTSTAGPWDIFQHVLGYLALLDPPACIGILGTCGIIYTLGSKRPKFTCLKFYYVICSESNYIIIKYIFKKDQHFFFCA